MDSNLVTKQEKFYLNNYKRYGYSEIDNEDKQLGRHKFQSIRLISFFLSQPAK